MSAILFKLHPAIKQLSLSRYDELRDRTMKHYPELYHLNLSDAKSVVPVNIKYSICDESSNDSSDSRKIHRKVIDYNEKRKDADESESDQILSEYEFKLCIAGCQHKLSWRLWGSKGGYLSLPHPCEHNSQVRITMTEKCFSYGASPKSWMVNYLLFKMEIENVSIHFQIENPWPWGIWKNASKFNAKLQRMIGAVIHHASKNGRKIDKVISEQICSALPSKITEENDDSMERVDKEFEEQCIEYGSYDLGEIE